MLKKYSDRHRFTFLTTFVAFLFGLYWTSISIAAEHIWFFISVPVVTFCSSYFIWTWTIRSVEDYKITYMFGVALILTVVTHYLNFVVLGLGRLLGFYFGLYNNYESLFETLTYTTFLRMTISFYYAGIISFILFTISGIYVIKTSSLKRTR